MADNKRFASRNAKVSSLLQGLAVCRACGYGYYRTSARGTRKDIYYYQCAGRDAGRRDGGPACPARPVRAAYLDTLVWDPITRLLADPDHIRAALSHRLG